MTLYSRPETPYVSVYCDGTSAGEHDRAPIASFYPDEYEGSIIWTVFTGHYYSPSLPHAIDVPQDVAQWLDGDEWIRIEGHDPEIFYRPGFRVRWNLGCPTCGLRRVVAKPSTLYASFTTLAQLRIYEVPLIHLIHSKSITQ